MNGVRLINIMDLCTGDCDYCKYAVHGPSTDPFGDEYIIDCKIENGYECEDRRILLFNNHWHLYRKIEDEYREIYRTESLVQAWRFLREDADPR